MHLEAFAVNPGWIPALVMVALQFGSVVWWAATTSADRKHAAVLDARRDEDAKEMRGAIAQLATAQAGVETRLQLLEKRPQPMRRPGAR